jgi:hypothetical protein
MIKLKNKIITVHSEDFFNLLSTKTAKYQNQTEIIHHTKDPTAALLVRELQKIN